MTSAKPLVAGRFQRRFFWAGKQGWIGKCGESVWEARGFDGGLPKNWRTRTPSLARIPQSLVVCSTPMPVR